jgi:hypothetical protein
MKAMELAVAQRWRAFNAVVLIDGQPRELIRFPARIFLR